MNLYRFIAALLLLAASSFCRSTRLKLAGQVLDPQSSLVPDAQVSILQLSNGRNVAQTRTDSDGHFAFTDLEPGSYTIQVVVPGLQNAARRIDLEEDQPAIVFQLTGLAARNDSITVVTKAEAAILFPDPAQQDYGRQNTLDANAGHPGAPISIPGQPIETASGGIKAPQYFAPGVAGDHGEPIAQYIQVGSYLLSNNLSANAHGNGYADPNILVPAVLDGVQVDSGAFNVREGNHAESLSAAYVLRSRLEPFVTLTGDARDVDLVLGFTPEGPSVDSWLAIEAAYGNGFLDRLEHRQRYKVNGLRTWRPGAHEITLFGIGYYGQSFVPGLVPIGVPDLHDTIDPRQKDQTHTGEIAVNDNWRLTSTQEIRLSSFFRTYNLALYSNFGDGLIRQSEFRTVAGGNATYTSQLTKSITLLAGFDYQHDAPRRLDLDHYLSNDLDVYGPFDKVTSNTVTVGDAAAYLAADGTVGQHFRFDLGWRRDEIQFDNVDLLNAANSYAKLVGFNSPKATVSFIPGESSLLPSASLSFGEAFYTNDPRIGTGTSRGTPVSRAHAYQLVLKKQIAGIEFRSVLGHMTTEASLAKIDPDTGLQEDEGPGRNKFITIAGRRYFGFGMLEASISKADARDLSTGLPIPEAPRMIVDVLGTYNKLPFRLQARAEFEEVGRKPLGDGFVSVPVREFRGSVIRSFDHERLNVGVNFLLASGYTGQTTEVIAAPGQEFATEQVTGVRLPSCLTLSVTYRFRQHR